MNKTIERMYCTLLKDGLAQCTEAQQHLFKQMYSHKKLDRPIADAVDCMDVAKLDWALTQVEKTLEKAAA